MFLLLAEGLRAVSLAVLAARRRVLACDDGSGVTFLYRHRDFYLIYLLTEVGLTVRRLVLPDALVTELFGLNLSLLDPITAAEVLGVGPLEFADLRYL